MLYSLLRSTKRVWLDKEQSAKTFYYRNQKPRLYGWVFLEIINHKNFYMFKTTQWLSLILTLFLVFFFATGNKQILATFLFALLATSLFFLLKKASLKNFLILWLFILIELLIIFIGILNEK